MAKTIAMSSREDFILYQYTNFKKLMKICGTMMDLVYITMDRESELSPSMRKMVPPYYVDPLNPEHPSRYILAGQSSIDYLERLMVVAPYVDAKGKYQFDLSGYLSLLVNVGEFEMKTKNFRKTKLEPFVIVGDRDGASYNQSLILREEDTPAKDELVMPFLHLPSRRSVGEDNYVAALNTLVFNPCYQYLYYYLMRSEESMMPYVTIDERTIRSCLDNDIVDFVADDGSTVIVTKMLLPCLRQMDRVQFAKVPFPAIDTSTGKNHYIIKEEMCNDAGLPYITIYTLLSALSIEDEEYHF